MRAVIAFFLIGAATAGAVEQPPPEFDRPHPNLRIILVPRAEINQLCEEGIGAPATFGYLACAEIGDGRSPCSVWLPEGYSDELFRHEQGHCNGWRHE